MLDKVIEYAAQNFPAHIDRLQRYLRQPSVSATDEGINEMADMLAVDIKALGGESKIIQTPEFPVVYGRFEVGAPRTILIHSMYDVSLAEEPDWIVPPFSAKRQELPGLGECIIARGAEDTKGPIASIFNFKFFEKIMVHNMTFFFVAKRGISFINII